MSLPAFARGACLLPFPTPRKAVLSLPSAATSVDRPGFSRHARGAAHRALRAAAVLACALIIVAGQLSASRAGDLKLPKPSRTETITIKAKDAAMWQAESHIELWLLRDVQIKQGPVTAQAENAVVWIDRDRYTGIGQRTTVYLEGRVVIEHKGDKGNGENGNGNKDKDKDGKQRDKQPGEGEWRSASAGDGDAMDAGDADDADANDEGDEDGEGDDEKKNDKEKTVRLEDASWYGVLESIASPVMETPPPQGEPAQKPPCYENALLRRHAYSEGVIRRAQFERDNDELGVPSPPGRGGQNAGPGNPQNNGQSNAPGGLLNGNTRQNGDAAAAELQPVLPPGTRRIQFASRNGSAPQIQSFRSQDGRETVVAIDGGINLVIDGLRDLGSVDVLTDRLVVWTSGRLPNLAGASEQSQSESLEIYMEGNVVFRQGTRVVYADRMYYDVQNEIGVIINAELLTPIPNLQGLARLKADLVQQTSKDTYIAKNAFLTTSRFGEPGYRLSSSEIMFEDHQVPVVDFTGQVVVDPVSGEPLTQSDRLATSFNNVLFVESVPAFYWPVATIDPDDPRYYLRKVSFGQDKIFGTQILTEFDAYQVLGLEAPDGTDWAFSLDYLSERGLGHGTKFTFTRPNFLGPGDPIAGFVDYWGIADEGEDTLGQKQKDIPPEASYRYRLLGRSRWELPWYDLQLTAEVGPISDRNFLEQFFELEWDTFKDMTTGFELKRVVENNTFSLAADAYVNDFFTDTQGVRLDHFLIGQPLIGDRFTWYAHTQIGYADMHTLQPPTDPKELADFGFLPWESFPTGTSFGTRSGERVATRQELDLPLEAGPVKVVPYALGELAHWGEDLSGEDIQRAYGQLGVRTSLPFWAADPTIESNLWNLHGLAHKITFEVDGSFSDATQSIDEFPLYDPLDDNAQEAFRRNFPQEDFGAPPPVPLMFDERYYALRSGLGDEVTSPSLEIADDLFAIRGSVRQKLQTKRGLPGVRDLRDWMILDTGITYFPDETRDNFGESFGLATYDYIWHIGDETAITSQGTYDFFNSGQMLTDVGLTLKRPQYGSMYVGYRSLQGPIDAQVVRFATSYLLSPKWILNFSTSYDFAESRNVGQRFTLVRVGESFLVGFGFSLDPNKDNFGIQLSVEPRLYRGDLGRVGGEHLPPAGAFGLE